MYRFYNCQKRSTKAERRKRHNSGTGGTSDLAPAAYPQNGSELTCCRRMATEFEVGDTQMTYIQKNQSSFSQKALVKMIRLLQPAPSHCVNDLGAQGAMGTRFVPWQSVPKTLTKRICRSTVGLHLYQFSFYKILTCTEPRSLFSEAPFSVPLAFDFCLLQLDWQPKQNMI